MNGIFFARSDDVGQDQTHANVAGRRIQTQLARIAQFLHAGPGEGVEGLGKLA